MKWFKTQPSPAEIEALESQKKLQIEKANVERDRKVQWIQDFTAEKSVPAFDDLYNQLEQLCSRPELLTEEERSNYQKSLDGFNQIRITWFKIDFDNIEESEAVALHDKYFSMLSFLGKYKKRVMEAGFYVAWGRYDGYSGSFGNVLEVFTDVCTAQTRKHTATTSNFIPTTNSFPVFAVTETAVKSSLERLSKLWTQAHEKEVSVENRYFLEQMISSYLPEAYRLYETFKFAPETLRNSAAELFQEQIGLMEEHLVQMLASYMHNNLNALQAQVTFLKQKTALVSSNEQLELTAVSST